MPRKSSIDSLSKRIRNNETKIKQIKEEIKPVIPRPSLKIKKQEVFLKRSVISPRFSSKTVLTDSTWRYVEIFLKEKKAEKALFYWEQAHNFYNATQNLTLISSPLTTYYTFLNAIKALLIFKGHRFDLKHGVSGKGQDGHYHLKNEIIKLQPRGIASSFSSYLREPIRSGGVEYSLKDILYKLQYIHRAFCLTFPSPELFIPIINPRFVYDKYREEAWFEAQLEEENSIPGTLKKLIGFSVDRKYHNDQFYTIRRDKTFMWKAPHNQPTTESIEKLRKYHIRIRKQLRYIYSPTNLWYLKRKNVAEVIDRSSLSLTFIAMHRLSELARYQPQSLKEHLERKASWLLSEFISKAMYQFIDHISSEITGDDFRLTGFRT